VSAVVDDKLSKLKSLLRSFESCVVAYSGGVDSVFMAVVAHEVLGDSAVAVIADSPSLPRHELQEAKSIAKSFGFRMEVIETQEFKNDEYLSNPVNRCYFCKAELFQRLVPYARDHGFQVIAYGENASDVGDYRPGRTAADEFSVRAPLREADLSKDEIRELSRRMGLPTADKPAQPCLSSRIPYGEAVSSEKLKLIEEGEQLIRGFGFVDVRVRLHEMKQGFLGRIELPGSDLERFFVEGCFEEVGLALRKLGFNHITVDLLGYRRGSLNEGIPIAGSPQTLQGRPAESLPQA
jgi:uncharacterized protein